MEITASTLFSVPGFTVSLRSKQCVIASYNKVEFVAALFESGVGIYAHPYQRPLKPSVVASVLGLDVPVSISEVEFAFTSISSIGDVRKQLLQLKPSTKGSTFPYSRMDSPTVPLLSGGRNLLVGSFVGDSFEVLNGSGSMAYVPIVPQGAAALAVHGDIASFMGCFSNEPFLAHALVLGEPSPFSLSEVINHAHASGLRLNFRVHSAHYGFQLVCAYFSLLSGCLCSCAQRGLLMEVVWKVPSEGNRKEVARVAKLFASLCSASLEAVGEGLVSSHDSPVAGSVLYRVSLPMNMVHVSLLSGFLSGLFKLDVPDIEPVG